MAAAFSSTERYSRNLPRADGPLRPQRQADVRARRDRDRPGNALTGVLGEKSFDIVFMSQLVHHFTDEQSRTLMKKIARALRPGGVCVMLDFIRPAKPGDGGQTAALRDLYFAMTSESGTWPVETLQDWLQSSGLKPLKPVWMRNMPGAALVTGRNP